MITIRSSIGSFEPALIALEAVLTTAQGVYTISLNRSGSDSSSTFRGGFFGAISWPRSRFRIAPGVVLEQQMFLPHDGSAAAFSWQLHAQSSLQARLTIKPFFSGCGPRSYSRCWFSLRLRGGWRSSHVAGECARTKSYRRYERPVPRRTDTIH